jgi:hypothetical protein
MWDFIEECGTWPKHTGVTGLNLGQSVKSVNAAMQDPHMKYRSLICEALKYIPFFSPFLFSHRFYILLTVCSSKNLREWLQLMMSYEPLTEKYYDDFALIRHKAVFQKYIDCVSRLTDLAFDLDVMYEAKLLQQRLAQEPAQAQQPVLSNIGSLFSSFLGPKSEDDNNTNNNSNNTIRSSNEEQKPKGLFGALFS